MIDLTEVQGGILRGYRFPFAAFLFVRLPDGDAGGAARGLLGSLAALVADAAPWTPDERPDDAVGVSVSYRALVALGVDPALLAAFPAEFAEGMDHADRAVRLGDTDDSAPPTWRVGHGATAADLLVRIDARTRERRDALIEDHTQSIEGAGATVLTTERCELLGGGNREHFGFADGFSQPDIDDDEAGPVAGDGTPMPGDGWAPVAPGEFVLGHRDEDGDIAGAALGDLGRGGTFTVARILRQHVDRWWSAMLAAAGGDPDEADRIAAKVIGRWPDGTPVVLSPDRPDPDLAGDPRRLNDFRYAADPGGRRCPIGAHVRRANPRDHFGWEGRLTKRHRMLRRGMPYGPRPEDRLQDDGTERGLVFVCHQASIERQFELVQSLWLADGDPFGLDAEPDHLLRSPHPHASFVIPGDPPRLLPPGEPFVTCSGGGYFFTPGPPALRALARGAFSTDRVASSPPQGR